MTVIATCMGAGEATLSGDALLWRERHGAPQPAKLYLPVTGERVFRPKPGMRYHVPAGLAQKVVMFGDQAAIAWADREDVAREILTNLRRNNVGPHEIEDQLRELHGEYPDHKRERVVFMGIACNNGWSKTDGNTICFKTPSPAEVVRTKDYALISSGSGAKNFCSKFQHFWEPDASEKARAPHLYPDNKINALFSTFACSVDELLHGVNQHDTFGGAFEVAFTTRDASTGRVSITKMNRTGYMFWFFKPEHNGLNISPVGRAVFQQYYKDSLVVSSEELSDDPEKPVDVTEIAPPGVRPYNEAGEELPWNHWEADKTMHVFFTPPEFGTGRHLMYMSRDQFIMRRDDDGLSVQFTDTGLKALFLLQENLMKARV